MTKDESWLKPLEEALRNASDGSGPPARSVDAALRSAVRAVLPGRQQKRNLDPEMEVARTAFLRTLRRRSRLP